MTQQEKQLLLKDLCARLPYGVKMLHSEELPEWFSKEHGKGTSTFIFTLTYDSLAYTITELDRVKPYLRTMSSMTEEEEIYYNTVYTTLKFYEKEDWLLAHHFDFRGLIEKSLALVAPEGMYEKK